MIFTQLYSSSAGNLYIITASNGKRLMIECGVVWSKLQKALNYDLKDIVGCLVSHEHLDHSKAIREVMQAGIDVFASAGTFGTQWTSGRRAKVIKDFDVIELSDTFKVRAFATNHDAAEPLGFIIKCDDEYLLFATDTRSITQRFPWPFSIIALGVSYDKDILQKRVDAGTINKEVAKRLLTSHMERREAMRYLDEFVNLSKCQQIHLLHMSGDNTNKERVRTEFEKRFFIETLKDG